MRPGQSVKIAEACGRLGVGGKRRLGQWAHGVERSGRGHTAGSGEDEEPRIGCATVTPVR